jgi:hypothetical protein
VSENNNGAVIPQSDFATDDGSPDPLLRRMLKSYTESATAESARNLLDVLSHARLLVPVVAVLDEAEVLDTGLKVDKDSHMRSVEFTSNDGRTAILAFTGLDSLQHWQDDARPIARNAFEVAQGALEQELDGLIIDIAGPAPTAIDGTLLALLAVGPNRLDLLDEALDHVCEVLEKIDGVVGADWDDTDEEVNIYIGICEPANTLSGEIAEVLQKSKLNVLLDRPLEVQLTDQPKPTV